MTFAADPQLNESYPLGELSYVIVISEIVDWNRMPGVEGTFLRRLLYHALLGHPFPGHASPGHAFLGIAYFCLSALAYASLK